MQLEESPERMGSNESVTTLHPVVSLFLILLMVALGFIVVGPILGFLISLPFYPGNIMEYAEQIGHPVGHPEIRIPLFILQAFATFIGLIVGPLLFARIYRFSTKNFFRLHAYDWVPVITVALIVIVSMGLNSLIIEWNTNLHFPGAFDAWARAREKAAEELVTLLTTFQSPGELVLALIVVAVLPAIGEEIVFRGLIQNELYRATKNVHVSIWLSAILFSAIHLQFFGFIPRLLLGALFGYLYYWSGNLTLAMVAHFLNNGISLLGMYFYQKGMTKFDPEKTEAMPLSAVAISVVLTAGLLYYFYHYFEKRKPFPQT